MKLLALDTSTIACSVALQCGDVITSRHEQQPREHSRLLLPMIRALLAEQRLGAAELDAVVLGNGPGSFVGMRIAASVAQGLCFAGNPVLVPVSSLAVVAVAALRLSAGRPVLVAQDAHMNEVYLAGFSAGPDGVPLATLAPRLQAAGRIDDLPPGHVAAGAGWSRYPALLDDNAAGLVARVDADYPLASDLLTLGMADCKAGKTIAPEQLEPAYLREQVATPPAGSR